MAAEKRRDRPAPTAAHPEIGKGVKPMKVAHISLVVKDLEANVTFYTRLFGCPPKILKPDYAKWAAGRPEAELQHRHPWRHAGRQSPGDRGGLRRVAGRQPRAPTSRTAIEVFGEGEIVCGYHRTDKGWVTDPQAVLWETFHSPEVTPHYGCTGEEVTEEVERRAKAAGLSD